MKKLIIIIMTLLFFGLTSFAMADPIVTCDPQEGVVGYGIVCDGNITINANANADGSMSYDTATWPGPFNTWLNCEAVACAPTEVVDGTTDIATDVLTCSEPAPFRMRINQNGKPNAFKVQ